MVIALWIAFSFAFTAGYLLTGGRAIASAVRANGMRRKQRVSAAASCGLAAIGFALMVTIGGFFPLLLPFLAAFGGILGFVAQWSHSPKFHSWDGPAMGLNLAALCAVRCMGVLVALPW